MSGGNGGGRNGSGGQTNLNTAGEAGESNGLALGGGGGGAGTTGGKGGDGVNAGNGGGGSGATIAGSNGSDGAGGMDGGGGGGGGGAHGFVDDTLPSTTDDLIVGGRGGDGGNAAQGDGGGGGGGAGGFGAIITGNGNLGTLDVSASGGNGGNGGRGGGGQSSAFNIGGDGGDGGTGLLLTSSEEKTLAIATGVAISGGTGGSGGQGSTAGAAGGNGVGLQAQNIKLTLENGATIAGGGTANAISFTGGSNILVFKGASDGLTGNIGAEGTLTFDQSTNVTVDSAITGGATVRKEGTGVLTLSGNNTYTGSTEITSGTVDLQGTLKTSVISVSNNAVFAINSYNAFQFLPIIRLEGTATFRFSETNSSFTARVNGVNGSNATKLELNKNTISIEGPGEFGGMISGIGGVFVSNGSGRQVFSGENEYSGVTTIANGTLIAAHVYALGSAAGDTIVSSGARLGLTGNIAINDERLSLASDDRSVALQSFAGANEYNGAITLSGSARINSDAGSTLTIGGTIDNGGNALTIGGAGNGETRNVISGTGGLIKDGAGTWTLLGHNTYTGTTAVNAGTLAVNGAIISNVTVASGGTLSGTGTVGDVNVENGGTLAAGNSTGTLNTRDLTLGANSTLSVEIADAALGSYDQISVNGTVTLGGALSLSFIDNYTPATGVSFMLIDNDSNTDLINGIFSGGATVQSGGQSYSISYTGGDGNDVVLTALNDAPSAATIPTDITVTEDIASNVDLSAITFADVDSGAADISLKIAASVGTLVAASTSDVTVSATGTSAIVLTGTANAIDAYLNTASNIQYTSSLNASGDNAATLTLTANDGEGEVSLGTVNIDITAVNDAPNGADRTITLLEDSSHAFSAEDFGFTDLQDNPANQLAWVTITSLPTAGTLTLEGSAVSAGVEISATSLHELVFTPATNANGAEYASLTFQVRDDGGTANDGIDLDPVANTLSFDVTAVNDAPVAVEDELASTTAGATIIYQAADLLENDTDADNEAQELSISAVNTVTGGDVSLNEDGTVSFTPTAGFTGLAQFTYTISDGEAESEPATASLTVNAVNSGGGGGGVLPGGSDDVVDGEGTPGDDLFDNPSFPGEIDGGDGDDTIAFDGDFSDFVIQPADGGFTIARAAEPDSVIRFANIEHLRFGDLTLDHVSGEAITDLYALYQTVFDRDPDISGLSVWSDALDQGLSIEDIAGYFTQSSEFLGLYGADPSNQGLIDQLYANLFGRDVEQTGQAFWLNALENGLSVPELVVAFSGATELRSLIETDVDDGLFVIA